VEEVQEAHECSSGRFVYTTARQPWIPRSTVQQILHESLHLYV
jgi:hypothetical protein